MSIPKKREELRAFCINFTAIIIAGLLFAGAFPNLVIEKGVPLMGWLTYIPLFWVIRRSRPLACVFWGGLYCFISYGLFNYWLSVFHPLAGLFVNVVAIFYGACFFSLSRLVLVLFPRRGYMVQCVCFIALQYIHSQGFLGYPYGIIAYSQWTVSPVIQLASITGIWGISTLMIFFALYIAAALERWSPDRTAGSWQGIKQFFRREWFAGCLWILCFGAALLYGFLAPKDYSAAPGARIALIQHNTDPWKPSKAPTLRQAYEEYQKDFRILKRLSLEALAQEPKPDLVVWSETAFIPRIYWHTVYRDDPDSYILIRELLEFLKSQETPFVFGNDDARLEVDETGQWDRVDYNAVFLYEQGELVQWYRKMHLVPFTEYFPYKKQLPWLYEVLLKADTHFWKQGETATVFTSSNGLKFSTPICFEDVFGYLSRDFVRNGAELIINLSNDAWSKSLPAQNQHLAMAVFRAIESRRSMVRSTASGQTCGIDPNGRILAMAEPFTEAYLNVLAPIVKDKTIYTKYGDYLPRIFLIAALLLLIGGSGRIIMIKVHNIRKEP